MSSTKNKKLWAIISKKQEFNESHRRSTAYISKEIAEKWLATLSSPEDYQIVEIEIEAG